MRQQNMTGEVTLRTALVTALLVMLHATAQPLAAQTPGPDLGDPPVWPLRSAEEANPSTVSLRVSGLTIDASNWQQVIDAYKQTYLPAPPDSGWTGDRASCNAGTTNQAFQDAVVRRINYFRAMAGVPADVTLLPDYNAAAQQAALMMSVNKQLSHTPAATWTCYTQTGHDAAGQGNLALGIQGALAIDGYMRDPGSGNSFVGHRRWILYPQTQHMGTGDIPGATGAWAANSLRVFDDFIWTTRPATRNEFVAWPPPGYVPQPLVYARWSFALAGADFSAASVVMQSRGSSVPVSVAPLAQNYGENTLVWILLGLSDGADWPAPINGVQVYQVSVNNVVVQGQPRNFTYSVTVVDPDVPPVAIELPVGEISLSGPGFVGSSFPPNAIVAILTPKDPSTASQFRYALGTGAGDADNAKFVIDGDALKTRVALAEVGKTYSVRVEATDGAGTKTANVFALAVKRTQNVYIPGLSRP